MAASQGMGPLWQVLYREQAYPDTFTSETFLEELVVSDSLPARTHWQVCRCSDCGLLQRRKSAISDAR